MGLQYALQNPSALLQGLELDPSDDRLDGFAYPAILGQAGSVGTFMDLSPRGGQPGKLNGSIRIRNKRDLAGAAADGAFLQDIGSPRPNADRFEPSDVSFSVRQIAAYAEELLKHIENAFSADEEAAMFRRAAMRVHLGLEKFCAAKFLGRSGATLFGVSQLGWRNVDYQAGAGGTAISGGASDTTIQTLRSIKDAADMAGGAACNLLILPQGVANKLASDPGVLGVLAVGDSAEGYAAVNVKVSKTADEVAATLSAVLGIKRVVLANSFHDDAGRGSASATSRIWGDDSIWLGHSEPMALNGNASGIIDGAGAFLALHNGLFEADAGPDKPVGAQHLRVTCDAFVDLIASHPTRGTVIHNLG